MTDRIIYLGADGVARVIVPSPKSNLSIQQIRDKVVPNGVASEIVDVSKVPSDRTFRGAWRKGDGTINTDLPAAKLIAHGKRREKRSEEYTTYDGDNEHVAVTPAAQVKRDEIKVKYDGVQTDLEACADVVALKASMVAHSLV